MQRECEHPARCLVNPRRAVWARGVDLLVIADCARARGGCGESVVLRADPLHERRQHLGDVVHGGARANGKGSDEFMRRG